MWPATSTFDPTAFIAAWQTPPHRSRRATVDRVLPARARGREPARQSTRSTGDDIGIALGSATAGLHTLVELPRSAATIEGPAGASALDFSNTVGNAAASLCGIEFGLRGINVTLGQKEASACAAIAHAASVLRAGRGARDDHRRRRRLRAHVLPGVRPVPRARHRRRRGRGLAALRPAPQRLRPRLRRVSGRPRISRLGAPLAARRPLGHLAGLGVDLLAVRPARMAGRSSRARSAACARRSPQAGRRARAMSPSSSPRPTRRVSSTASRPQALEAVFGPSGVPVVAVKGALGECGAAAAAGLRRRRALVEAGASSRPRVGFEVARSRLSRGRARRRRARSIRASRRSRWSTALPAAARNVSLVVTDMSATGWLAGRTAVVTGGSRGIGKRSRWSWAGRARPSRSAIAPADDERGAGGRRSCRRWASGTWRRRATCPRPRDVEAFFARVDARARSGRHPGQQCRHRARSPVPVPRRARLGRGPAA